jgi:hypothetical protein
MLSKDSLVVAPQEPASDNPLIETADAPTSLQRLRKALVEDAHERPAVLVADLRKDVTSDLLDQLSAKRDALPGLACASWLAEFPNRVFLEGLVESDIDALRLISPEFDRPGVRFSVPRFHDFVDDFCNQIRLYPIRPGALVRLALPSLDGDPAQVVGVDAASRTATVRCWPRVDYDKADDDSPGPVPPAAPFDVGRVPAGSLWSRTLEIADAPGGDLDVVTWGESMFCGKFQYVEVGIACILIAGRPFTREESERFPERHRLFPAECLRTDIPEATEEGPPDVPEQGPLLEPMAPMGTNMAPDRTLYEGGMAKVRYGPLRDLRVSIKKIDGQFVTAELGPRGTSGHATHFQSLAKNESTISERLPPYSSRYPPGTLVRTLDDDVGVVLSVYGITVNLFTLESEEKSVCGRDIAERLADANQCYDCRGVRIMVGDVVTFESSDARVVHTYGNRLILSVLRDNGREYLMVMRSDQVALQWPPPIPDVTRQGPGPS